MSAKQKKWMPVVIWILLGGILRCLPGVRFSSSLCFLIGGLWALGLGLSRWAETARAGRICRRVFLAGLCAVSVVLCSFEVAIITRGEEDFSNLPVDAIVVLGAGVNGETPSLTLQTRIQRAAACMEQHPEVPVVLSGGQGSGERISEAECMRRELWTDDESWNRRLLLEDQSTSTAENFAYSKAVLEAQGLDLETAVVGVVTNDFHIFRAKLIAQEEGLQTIGVPAELPWWWLTANYYLRESFALVKTLIFDMR